MNVCVCGVVWWGVELYGGYRVSGGCPWEKGEEGHSDKLFLYKVTENITA